MSETCEKDELTGLIDRSRAGIAQHLIEMGVKDDAAARAVSEQVEFGRALNGTLLMKRGKWVASPVSYQRECAAHILSSLSPERSAIPFAPTGVKRFGKLAGRVRMHQIRTSLRQCQ